MTRNPTTSPKIQLAMVVVIHARSSNGTLSQSGVPGLNENKRQSRPIQSRCQICNPWSCKRTPPSTITKPLCSSFLSTTGSGPIMTGDVQTCVFTRAQIKLEAWAADGGPLSRASPARVSCFLLPFPSRVRLVCSTLCNPRGEFMERCIA